MTGHDTEYQAMRTCIHFVLALIVGFGSASISVGQGTAPAKSKPPVKTTTTGTTPKPAKGEPTPAKRDEAKPSNETKTSEVPTLRRVDRKELKETPSPTGGEEYLLRYKFTPGLVISSEVIHIAKTDTKVDSAEQNSQSRTVSQKTWEVTKADKGEFTFEYRINHIDMSQQVGEGKELRYSSSSGEEPDRQFQGAAASVGKVISTVTIDEQGLIVARSDDRNPPNLGMGDITLPVPSKPIAVGATWEIPRELRIQRQDGSVKIVKFRELFKLEKVSAGIATVSVRSEPLTAITEAAEEAQVLQQLSNGTIRFDIDAGHMISKELSWDKTVVGFSGDGSVMGYSARLDESVKKAELAKGPADKNSSKR